MAERRMFAKSIVFSDAFLDMPMSARCLYFSLGMQADDDGFVGAPKSVMRQCGASQDDLLILISKRFVLSFDSGVVVIKHWKINNYIRSDRYTSTTYIEELSQLTFDAKGAYTEKDGIPVGIPGGIPRLGKDSIGKVIKVEADARACEPDSVPPLGQVMSFFMDRINSDPTPLLVDSIKSYLEKGLEPDVIIHAMSIAIDEKKTSWSYIKAILQRYVRDGLTTMRAVLDEEKRHEAGKGGSYAAGRKEPASAPRGHGPGGRPLPSAIDEY